MADWEEIKRLAADLQRVQISSTAHKLSERNCIEIVQKLISLGLVEVIYTTDGKEYLTPQELEREVKDELFVHGGRINLVDLQQIINVDLSHVEGKVAEILKYDHNLVLIQGELIDREYLDRVAEEINETLQESGQVLIGELSKNFCLPADFLLETVESRLGSIIHGRLDQFDRGVLFTDAFIARQSAKIRGVFSAITRPTTLSTLIIHFGFQEKLFYSVISELLASGRLSGTIQGRQDKAVFVPDIYSQTQNAWIDGFFKQNGYIEYDATSRLGITDAKQFLKRRFKTENPKFLPTCCVGKAIQDHVEATIDEALLTGTWVDIMPLLPSPFTPSDATQLLNDCLRSLQHRSPHVFCDSMVVSQKFVTECRGVFDQLMTDKAEKDAAKCPALFAELSRKDVASLSGEKGGSKRDQKKEERKKKAAAGGSGSKGGGGRGARETKTQKSRDKKRDRSTQDDNEEDNIQKLASDEIEFMSEEEIAKVLQVKLDDCPEELVEELSQFLYRPLRRVYQEVARSVFTAGTGDKKRKSHSEVQDKINGLYANAKLFDKGIKRFEEDVQSQLSRHLLRTVCMDMVNLAFNLLAADHMIAVADEATLTAEARLKIIAKVPEKIKAQLIKLNSAVGGKDTEEFFSQFEVVSGPDYCEFMIKKLDKKRERQIMIEHRCALEEQLRHELEPAMALHLTAVLLFHHYTNCLVHAPGRCVPQIISFLNSHMAHEQYSKLAQYQALVIKKLYGGSAVDERAAEEKRSEASENGEARTENGEKEKENEDVEKSAASLLDEGLEEIKKLALEIRKAKDESQR